MTHFLIAYLIISILYGLHAYADTLSTAIGRFKMEHAPHKWFSVPFLHFCIGIAWPFFIFLSATVYYKKYWRKPA